jgi:hypothetical protein
MRSFKLNQKYYQIQNLYQTHAYHLAKYLIILKFMKMKREIIWIDVLHIYLYTQTILLPVKNTILFKNQFYLLVHITK